MTRIPVESSQIEAIGHEDGVMEVLFKNRSEGKPAPIYRYEGVPRAVFDEILASDSVGRAFNQLVKAHPRTYPYVKIDAEAPC